MAAYSGDLVDGHANGWGTKSFPDGSKYEGEWAHGQSHGAGTVTDAHASTTGPS